MPSSAVQFWGLDSVIKAYKNMGVGPFALLQGKQFLFASDTTSTEMGAGVLRDYLEMMGESGANSYATYTIRVYDDLAENERIKAGTDYTGSFNFSLYEHEGGSPRGGSKIAALEARIKELEGDGEPAEMGGIMGFLDSMLKREEVQGAIFSWVGGLVTKILQGAAVGNPAPAYAVGSVAGLPEMDQLLDNETRLKNALTKIATADPDILIHLEKLADMAEKTPDHFRALLNFLK